MKVLTASIAILLMLLTVKTNAAVIGGDYNDDIVAVYYFNSQFIGIVNDHGVNAVPGNLREGATLTEGKYGKCLSLPTKASDFFTLDPHIFLDSHNKFSITAWVKIPNQEDVFSLEAVALNLGETGNVVVGRISLAVKADGNLQGSYRDLEDGNGLTVSTQNQNISNNMWTHIAFTVSRSQMKFYLNGEPSGQVAREKDISFSGAYTGISIGRDAMGLVDNVGFFSDTFSDTDIKLIYDVGLEKIISIASVEPEDKVTTTWGRIKSLR